MKTIAVLLATYIFSLSSLPLLNVLLGNELGCCMASSVEDNFKPHSCEEHEHHEHEDDLLSLAALEQLCGDHEDQESKNNCHNCNPFCCFKCVPAMLLIPFEIFNPVNPEESSKPLINTPTWADRSNHDIWHPPV